MWPNIPFATVRFRFASIAGDEWAPKVGTRVTLTPSIIGPVVWSQDGERITVEVGPVRALVDDEGWLTDDEGVSVLLLPNDLPEMSVTGWTWRADFQCEGPRIVFTTSSEGVVDLSEFVMAPAVDSTKVWVDRIPELIQIIEDGAIPDEVMAQAIADYLAANPIVGMDPAVYDPQNVYADAFALSNQNGSLDGGVFT